MRSIIINKFNTDLEIQPTFSKGAIVRLTKDCTQLDNPCSEYLKKEDYCSMIGYGFFEYIWIKTNTQQECTDGLEWCHVNIVNLDPDCEEGFVKAQDLILVLGNEIGLNSQVLFQNC